MSAVSLPTVIDAAGDAVVAVDRDGRITHWNAAASALLGHSHGDAIGETLALVIPPEHRPRHIAAFHTAIDTGHLSHDGQPAVIEASHRDGHTIRATMTLGVIAANDEVSGIVAVLRADAEPTSFV